MARGLSGEMFKANLAVGSPDIKVHDSVLKMVKAFTESLPTHYIPVKGTIKALENVSSIVAKDLIINPNLNISLCNGAKFGIYLSLKTITNPGDHVLLLEPYWLSYPDICKSLNLKFSSIQFEIESNQYNLIQIKKTILQKNINVIIINNPVNPSGFVFSTEFLEELSSFCLLNNVWLMIDEVYKDLTFKKNEVESFSQLKGVVRVGSLSKSFAIPGFRLGYVIGEEEFIRNFILFNQHISTCITNLSNYIGENITQSDYLYYTSYSSNIYEKRSILATNILTKKGYKVLLSDASFYLLCNVSHKFKSGDEAVSYFESKGIILTSGSQYGSQFTNYIRICLTLELQKLASILEEF